MCRCQGEDSSYAGCRNNGTTIEGIEILKKLNVSRGVGENVGALLVFIVVFRILTYLSLALSSQAEMTRTYLSVTWLADGSICGYVVLSN